MKKLWFLILVIMTTSTGFAQDGTEDNAPMKFVNIPKGSFKMGRGEIDRSIGFYSEPQRGVTLTHSFEMQWTTVTQMQWYEVMKGEGGYALFPSRFYERQNCPESYKVVEGHGMCPNHPVQGVNWIGAAKFANAFSKRNNLEPCYEKQNIVRFKDSSIYECSGYRLPTSAEWEYAARGGKTTAYFFGDSPVLAPTFAVFVGNNPGGEDGFLQPAEVASLEKNPFGLYDIVGNLWQWVNDSKLENVAVSSVDPLIYNLADGERLIRGGCYANSIEVLRSDVIGRAATTGGYDAVGFRLVRTLK